MVIVLVAVGLLISEFYQLPHKDVFRYLAIMRATNLLALSALLGVLVAHQTSFVFLV